MTCAQLRLIAKACFVTLNTPKVMFMGVNHFSDTIEISNAKWLCL